jgi:hypothetical protein
VVDRHLFYNNSFWDGNNAALGVADDSAIAPDKSAYLPGDGLAWLVNTSSFTRGITGIMVDLAGGAAPAAITDDDFLFKVGNDNTPAAWSLAPAPSAVAVRLGAGTGGSDRVSISWASNAIANQWLEVQVLATADTGLAVPDVHFWGNKVADSLQPAAAVVFETTLIDAAQVFANLTASASIVNPHDYNRSGTVSIADAAVVFANLGSIARINIGAGGPFAPENGDGRSDGGGSAVALTLAGIASGSALDSKPSAPIWQPTGVNVSIHPASARLADDAASIVARSRAAIAQGDPLVIDLQPGDELLDFTDSVATQSGRSPRKR